MINKKKLFILILFVVASCSSNKEEKVTSTLFYYDLDKSELNLLKEKAIHGDANASVRVANYYLMAQNQESESYFWFQLGSELGNYKATSFLAGLYAQYPEKYRKAIELYLKIVDFDSVRINKSIAVIYEDIGELESAIIYYRKAALSKDFSSSFNLAKILSNSSLHKELDEAYHWVLQAKQLVTPNTYMEKEVIALENEIQIKQEKKRRP